MSEVIVYDDFLEAYWKDSVGEDITKSIQEAMVFDKDTLEREFISRTANDIHKANYLKILEKEEVLEHHSKYLYYKHINFCADDFPYFWMQCSKEYQDAWRLIAAEDIIGIMGYSEED